MSSKEKNVLYDSIKNIIVNGVFKGSIISKYQDKIIFSDNIKISNSDGINISDGLVVGFEEENEKKVAFSKKINIFWKIDDEIPLEYSVLIPDEIMDVYSEEQFSDAFPFTINLLHTAGLYLSDFNYGINHLNFFIGEILKNPVTLIENGMLIADRVVINDKGDPVFYDCLIVGRDQKDELQISYEPLTNVDDKVVKFIIILGRESLTNVT